MKLNWLSMNLILLVQQSQENGMIVSFSVQLYAIYHMHRNIQVILFHDPEVTSIVTG